jgi:hypothetical protein
MKRWIATILLFCAVARGQAIEVAPVDGSAGAGQVEIVGVGAGAFDAARWAKNPPNFVADLRSPMIEPLPGKFRNIYAPSAVETPDGWRIFYGAWDGQDDPHDRIYSLETADFLTFRHREKIIEHGAFDHVCNVSAVRNPDGSFEILCTAFPDALGKNKPIHFSSRDGEKWNSTAPPYIATAAELVRVEGYPDFAAADINGMNVLLRDGNQYSMFFGDFSKFGHIYRAVGDNAQHFRVTGECLSEALMVNDVKKIGAVYLMALHANRGALYYTLSENPAKFPPTKVLFEHLGNSDRFMVADGWVIRGDCVLGVLYGAGANPNLAENRIFARWVQKKVAFVTDRGAIEAARAMGPDRAVLEIPAEVHGHFEISSEFGELIGRSSDMTIQPRTVYRIAEDMRSH